MAPSLVPTLHPNSRSVNNRELRDISAEAIAALQHANDPPVLFVRSGQAVHVVSDELGRHTIVEASEAFLRGRMTRSADFRRLVHDKNRQPHYPAVNPPIDTVRDVLALAPEAWGFPALESVTKSPLLRPDGTVMTTAGYDRVTRSYYSPSPDLKLPIIPAEPSDIDVTDAVALLAELCWKISPSPIKRVAPMPTRYFSLPSFVVRLPATCRLRSSTHPRRVQARASLPRLSP
jgi:hypothetical protein